jgi:hypothetical protein
MQSAGGHEIMMYDTEGDKKIIIRHASGSGIEFTNDGSIIFIANKDILFRGSRVPATSNNSVRKIDNDDTYDVATKLQIKASSIEFEAQKSFSVYSAGDLTLKGNNVVNKGKENISIESAKSLYIDTQELRERTVTRQSEIGSQEGPGGSSIAPLGGSNEINVMGNTIIRNNNPAGGITIQSAGYLNFVCGAERVDVTGNPAIAAAALTANATAGTINPYFAFLEGRATYTHNVYPNPGPQPAVAILPPGSAYFRTIGGYRHDCAISYNLNTLGLRLENHTGFFKRFTKGQELVTVKGPRIVIAKPLILN